MLEFKAVRLAAHPRVSGENVGDVLLARPLGGSSPRERGKLYGFILVPGWLRLIPA